MKTVAVILAGGKSSRLWPITNEKHPKLLLEIFPHKTMLAESLLRARLFTDDVLILTKKTVYEALEKELSENNIDQKHIIIEPDDADSAAAYAFAVSSIKKQFGSDTLVVFLPSDSRIKNYGAFYRDVRFALKKAESNNDLILFGITPTYAATGYGYVKIGKKLGEDDRETIFKIESFLEKPDSQTANKYLASADYLWNSGTSVGKIRAFESTFKTEPILDSWYNSLVSDHRATMPDSLKNLDYWHGITQKSTNLAAVVATFDWSDIGSYETLYEIEQKTDEHGNSVAAHASIEDCENCMIIGRSKRIVALGLNDIVIVDQPDGILVCHKSTHSDLVGQIATGLKQPGR
jgi:mannose-1-phosphate guanylyltransferase